MFIQFITATPSNKLSSVLSLCSFIDLITVPPSILSVYLNRTWIGKLTVMLQCCYHSGRQTALMAKAGVFPIRILSSAFQIKSFSHNIHIRYFLAFMLIASGSDLSTGLQLVKCSSVGLAAKKLDAHLLQPKKLHFSCHIVLVLFNHFR